MKSTFCSEFVLFCEYVRHHYLLYISVCGFPHVVILNNTGQRLPGELWEEKKHKVYHQDISHVLHFNKNLDEAKVIFFPSK